MILSVSGISKSFDGKEVSLKEIIHQHQDRLPPTGTGDCCAPKLLSYAFEHGLIPVSMDEVFYGKDSPNKKRGTSYPPCDERCGYILPEILGLEILYCDKDIIVINYYISISLNENLSRNDLRRRIKSKEYILVFGFVVLLVTMEYAQVTYMRLFALVPLITVAMAMEKGRDFEKCLDTQESTKNGTQ